jgi:hypothetical protein
VISPKTEKALLQAVVGLACLVPLMAGSMGVLRGVAWLHGDGVSLDSQFRYMSGIFLGLGIAFVSCIPGIEHKTGRFRLLGVLAVLGGLARGLSWIELGPPDTGMRFGLVMELLVLPCLMLWQGSLARRIGTGPS